MNENNFLPADPIGELDPYEGCCHWCGKRGCDGDCRCPGCGEACEPEDVTFELLGQTQ